MIVRDMFHDVPEERIIARAIFEDRCRPENIYGWITKYYAQLIKLKSAKVKKSDMMFFMSVVSDDREAPDSEEGMSDVSGAKPPFNRGGRIYADVSGFSYEDIKAGSESYYGIEFLNYRQYASLYVPDYTVQLYGKEVVASEALREYGWNGYDDKIVCTDEFRVRVLQALDNMKQELYPADINYMDRCRKQFCKAYEGKEVPQWEDAGKTEEA
ncbi:MAG: hypothetical protein K5770_08065 [Lachnospiraceae bacterium]|nr:hypothetical protein [Lachnospiraceae bacterium]